MKLPERLLMTPPEVGPDTRFHMWFCEYGCGAAYSMPVGHYPNSCPDCGRLVAHVSDDRIGTADQVSRQLFKKAKYAREHQSSAAEAAS